MPRPFQADAMASRLAQAVRVPPADYHTLTFQLGNPFDQGEMVSRYGPTERCYSDSAPRLVTLDEDFHVMRFPVTTALFAQFTHDCSECGKPYITTGERRGSGWALKDGEWGDVAGATWVNVPGSGTTAVDRRLLPVTCVSWYDAVAFCRWLNDVDGQKGGRVYRLPTEDEWEIACGAGSTTAFWWGDELDDVHAVHSCGEHGIRSGPEPVELCWQPGRRRTNPWGLSDMLGQVWEWCLDAPAGGQELRALRGGSWGSSSAAGRLLASNRGRMHAEHVGDRNGFRVVLARPLNTI